MIPDEQLGQLIGPHAANHDRQVHALQCEIETLRQALAEEQESRALWIKTYRELDVVRQALGARCEALEEERDAALAKLAEAAKAERARIIAALRTPSENDIDWLADLMIEHGSPAEDDAKAVFGAFADWLEHQPTGARADLALRDAEIERLTRDNESYVKVPKRGWS